MSGERMHPAAGCNGGRGAGGYLAEGHPETSNPRPVSKASRLEAMASGPGGMATVSGQTARELLGLL